MRILNVTRSMDPIHGGPAEVIRQFAPVLRALGHEVITLAADPSDSAWCQADASIIAQPGHADTYGYSPALRDWLRSEAALFDAVISHGLWQYHGVAVRQVLREKGLPYFVYPHGMLDPWFRKAYPAKHLKKQLYWLFREHSVLRDARAVIFTCEEERRMAQGTFWPYCAKEVISTLGTAGTPVDLGVARETFLNAFPSLKGERILLFLGRLHPKKGCDFLVKAMAQLRAGFHLVFAGPPESDSYLKALKQGATGVEVTFTGMLQGTLKWGAFASADAFILPSHQENFGMAVAEALSCGIPVLVSQRVNIWREIVQDEAGYAAPDTLEGTVELLQRWSATAEEGKLAMKRAAKACFATRFEIGQSARNLVDLLARQA